MRKLLATAALGALVAAGVDARADEPKSAEALATEAYDLYQAGRFQESLAVYQKAYEKEPAAAILFNIARIYERKLGDPARAEQYYKQYVAAPDADPELAKKAREFLATREAERKTASSRAPAVTTVPDTEPRATTTDDGGGQVEALRIAGWASLGVGVTALGVGTIFGIVAMNKNDDAAEICNGSACAEQSGVDLIDEARSAATVSTVAFVAGGVLAAAGVVVVLATRSGSGGDARMSVAPALGPRVGGLVLSGGFW